MLIVGGGGGGRALSCSHLGRRGFLSVPGSASGTRFSQALTDSCSLCACYNSIRPEAPPAAEPSGPLFFPSSGGDNDTLF